MLEHNLIQAVNEPTRVQGFSSNILDLLFVNHDFSECVVSVDEHLSDHKLVNVSLPILTPVVSKRTEKHCFKNFAKADDASIIDYTETYLGDFTDTDNDVFTLWSMFVKMCRHCINTFVPNKTKTVNKQTPWMTRNILQLKRKLKKAKRRVTHPNLL